MDKEQFKYFMDSIAGQNQRQAEAMESVITELRKQNAPTDLMAIIDKIKRGEDIYPTIDTLSSATFRLGFSHEKANLHNQTVTAGTAILDETLSTPLPVSLFRIQAAFSALGKLAVLISKDGNVQTVYLNSAQNLEIGALYVFDLLVHAEDIINFSYSVNATMQVLRIHEVKGGQ